MSGAERIIKDNSIAGGEISFSVTITMRKNPKLHAESWKVYSQLDSLTSIAREEINVVPGKRRPKLVWSR